MMRVAFIFWLGLLTFTASGATAAEVVWLERFTQESAVPPEPWQLVRFSDKIAPTQYRIAKVDDVYAIVADADHSMALMARPVTIDLEQTPVACWRWRIDAPLEKADMAKKSGDDYAARVYLSFSLPKEEMGFMLRSKLALARTIYGDTVPDAALNYVWDNRYSIGTKRANAYTDRTQMIVAQSGSERAGEWVKERHDVQADVSRAFNTNNATLIQLAVAADTDNTGEKARAWFADFHFVSRDAPCN